MNYTLKLPALVVVIVLYCSIKFRDSKFVWLWYCLKKSCVPINSNDEVGSYSFSFALKLPSTRVCLFLPLPISKSGSWCFLTSFAEFEFWHVFLSRLFHKHSQLRNFIFFNWLSGKFQKAVRMLKMLSNIKIWIQKLTKVKTNEL